MWRRVATAIARNAIGLAAFAPPPAATAQVLPPVQIVLNPRICPGGTSDHFSCDFDSPEARYHVDGTAVLTPVPSLESNATVDFSPASFGIGSIGALTYSFEVVGPPDPRGQPIPLLVSASGSVFALGHAVAFAAWRYAGSTVQDACVPLGDPGCGTTTAPSFGGITPLLAYPGVVGTIELLTDVAVSDAGAASASVDPTIEVDPAYANASQYQIVLSEGVGNAPEPQALGSAACVVLGLAAVRRIRVGRLRVATVARAASIGAAMFALGAADDADTSAYQFVSIAGPPAILSAAAASASMNQDGVVAFIAFTD